MAKKGPTKGGRVLVRLPFGDEEKPVEGKKAGKSKLVRMKSGVAKFLGFKPIDKLPEQTVKMKTAKGDVTVTRTPNVGARGGRSITIIFNKPKSIPGSSGTYKTVAIPLASGCTNHDAIEWFQQNGTSKGIIGLKTTEGRTVLWDYKDK